MTSTMKRTSDDQIELFDDQGHLIGTIIRPVTTEVLGPGAEKVYLARRESRPGSPSGHPKRHAA